MNAVSLLREQFKSAHDTLESTMADVSSSISNFNETKKAMPVGAAYAHAVLGEDLVLSTMVTQKTPITKDMDLGLSIPMPSMDNWEQNENWYKTVQVDLIKMKDVAPKIYQATDDYLATLKDEDLEKEIDVPGMGKHNLAWLLTNFLLLHIANLTGEISAAKGLQGLKGYPF